MIITKDELQRRLKSTKNILNTLPPQTIHVVPVPRGNTNGQKSEPISITENIAGAVSAITGHVEESARTFGVNPAQVRAARNSRAAQEARERVSELALTKLMAALGLLTPDKLVNADLDDLSKVAVRMAGVIEKMTPAQKESINNNSGVQVLLYMPEQRQTGSYKVIDV